MKSIVARPILLASGLYLLIGFTATQAYSGEYFIYQDARGRLIISNQKAPPGSKIIKQQTLPDTAEGETVQVQEGQPRPEENANSSKSPNKELHRCAAKC